MAQGRKQLLGLVLALALCPLALGAQTAPQEWVPAARLEAVAQDYQVPQEFLAALAGREGLTVADLKAQAVAYGLPAQYLQRFVEDSFIIKTGSQYRYIPVDFSLALNDYCWDYLSQIPGSAQREYLSDGRAVGVTVIDVSAHQGEIDWQAVKAGGVDYAYIRLGYRGYATGAMALDAQYQANIQGARAAGVKVGVYFYSQAVNPQEAREEARFTLEQLADRQLDLPVVLDLEGPPAAGARTQGLTPGQYADIIDAFCVTVEQAGVETMVYSYANFFADNLDMARLQGRDLWVAQYYQEPFFPYQFVMWQYTHAGQVPGIRSGVDLNILFLPQQAVGLEMVEER